MYSYALLEPSCYYLIREKKDADISLIKINVESDHCVFLSRFQNEETLEWKKKNAETKSGRQKLKPGDAGVLLNSVQG